MATIGGILKSKRKPKEIVELLAEALKSDKKLIGELFQCFEDGTITEKGSCMEASVSIDSYHFFNYFRYSRRNEPFILINK